MSALVSVALAQYPIEAHETYAAFDAKITRWCEEAARAGAQILVFPEYAWMELTSLLGQARGDLRGSIEGLQALLPAMDARFAALAQRLGVVIIAGTAPVKNAQGRFINTARVHAPSGKSGAQEKCLMTRFEDEAWGIAAGAGAAVFQTPFGAFGVCTCFDVEFPLQARAMAEAGATIIFAPSCTETLRGAWRVRIGAQARALENQFYACVSPLVGEAPWSPAVDVNVGWAGAYGPPDLGFPDDGVVALGDFNAPTWVHARLDLDKVAAVRAQGAVFNYKRWDDQAGARVKPAALIDLR